MNRKRGAVTQPHGFTTLQMVVTIAIISVISVFGVLGITQARAEFRLQNSARLFASYIEKARVDAIRRHAPEGSESSIETFGPGSTTYAVTMDFGSGALETRTFSLESGLTFVTAAKKLSFDWRGRIAEAWVFQIFSSFLQRGLPVDVSGSGDITVGEQHFPDQLIPPVEVSQVTGDVADATPTPSPTLEPTPPIEETPTGDEVDPTPTPTPTPTPSPSPTSGNGNGNGSDNGNNGNGSGNPSASPTPTSSPTATPDSQLPQCVATISPSTLSLSQSDTGKQTGTATFTMVNATGVRTISASQAGNGNSLGIELSLVRIDGNGSSIITINTKQGGGNRGVFIVDISASPSCGTTTQLTVSVSN